MYKVMIVDDRDIVRRELRRMPVWGEASGFEIHAEAKNGQEALDLLKTEKMDLVITDIRMPKVDGLELLKKINEKNLARCAVLLSDYTDFNYARQGLVFGAFDYLVKPAGADDLAKLLGRVRESLESREREAGRLQMIEAKLKDKVMAFFPAADVERLISLILAGDDGASELAAGIADFSAASLGEEPIKTEFLLKNIMSVVVQAVLGKKSWLGGFIDRDAFLEVEKYRVESIGEMKRIFCQKADSLRSLIGRLECSVTDNEAVKRLCRCVLEGADGEMSLKVAAEKLFMNRTYLSEVFRQKTGMQFIEYLTMVKMERAKLLLGEGRLKTYEIAGKLGFKDIEYFSRLFKKYAGMPPVEYRQRKAI